MAQLFEQTGRDPEFVQELRVLGLLFKAKNMSVGIAVQNSKARSRLPVDRGGSQRDVGARLEMCLQQVCVIHPVELIAAQDEVIFIRAIQKVAEILAHRVCRALVPAGVLRCLLGGKNLNEAISKAVKFVAARDVAVQGLAVKLS